MLISPGPNPLRTHFVIWSLLALPFPILGFDTDNGSEFLNWHLLAYFGKRNKPVHFTRSRAYRKNDNARVEQKNWTHVRQLVGYGRLEGERVAELLDALYREEWSWFRNFFCPVMKHLRTEIKGSRKRRISGPRQHLDPAKTIFPSVSFLIEATRVMSMKPSRLNMGLAAHVPPRRGFRG